MQNNSLFHRITRAASLVGLLVPSFDYLRASEIITVTSKGPAFNLPAGETATLLYGFSSSNGAYSIAQITFADGTSLPAALYLPANNIPTGPMQMLTVAGPCALSVATNSGAAFLTFKISRSTEDSSVIPVGAVVIPAEGAGKYEVSLESSTDLVTWVYATPGTYGSGATNRFFRVRLQRAQ